MIALIQRVSEASVLVNKNSPDGEEINELTGKIGPGILALVAVERGDTKAQADRLLQRLLAYRIFEDDSGRMNLNLRQIKGELRWYPNSRWQPIPTAATGRVLHRRQSLQKAGVCLITCLNPRAKNWGRFPAVVLVHIWRLVWSTMAR